MASEAETRLQKQVDSLQAQLNAARVDIRKLYRLITHPSALTRMRAAYGEFAGLGATVVTETSFGQSSTAGTDLLASKADHTHGTPTNPVPAHIALDIHGYNTVVAAGITTVPLASTIYYFGFKTDLELQTVAIMAPVYIPKPGSVKVAYVHWYDNVYGGGVPGSNEPISLYFRLNDTTDTLIETIGSVASSKLFSNIGLNIAVVQGDYFEIKMITPAWATPPVDVALGGIFYIREA